MSLYFAIFSAAARSAAATAANAVCCKYDAAKVSYTVASQTKHFPLLHGIKVIPSGLLPSCLLNPGGSLTDCIFALVRPLQMMSFISACLCCRPPTFLHDKLCSPRPSTIPPQTHRCGSQIFKPSLSPVATLISSSDKRSPIAATGKACNQSPE